jgi:hypothetical protein
MILSHTRKSLFFIILANGKKEFQSIICFSYIRKGGKNDDIHVRFAHRTRVVVRATMSEERKNPNVNNEVISRFLFWDISDGFKEQSFKMLPKFF